MVREANQKDAFRSSGLAAKQRDQSSKHLCQFGKGEQSSGKPEADQAQQFSGSSKELNQNQMIPSPRPDKTQCQCLQLTSVKHAWEVEKSSK